MSIWHEVEAGIAGIQAVLATTPLDGVEIQRLVTDLAKVVKSRKVTPRTFSPAELENAVEHLAFEMQHFRSYGKLYNNVKLTAFSKTASQAIRYSLLVHLRVLVDFFYSEPTQDDCHIEHFNVLPGFEAAFPAILHSRTQDTSDMSVHLNKLLAHMTATRWENRRPAMDYYDKYSLTIDGLITKFEAALPTTLKAVYAREYLKWSTLHPGTIV